MTKDPISSLLEICDNATPGPWVFYEDEPEVRCEEISKTIAMVVRLPVDGNRAFISTFNPAKVRELLEDYQSMQECLEAFRDMEESGGWWGRPAQKCLASLKLTHQEPRL